MGYPSVEISYNEVGAPTPLSGDQVPNAIGVCSLGVTGQAYSFGNTAAMKAGLGRGHLVDVLQVLKEAGVETIYATPADETTIAGTTSAVTLTGTGSPMVVAGTALHDLEIVAKVVAGGTTANGLARIQWAVDGYPDTDPTFAAPVVVTGDPITLADTGMTIDWPDIAGPAAATLVLGAIYRCSIRPAHYNSGGAPTTTQLQSLLTRSCSYLLYTGASASASGAATLASAVGVVVNSLAVSAARFIPALIPASIDADTAVVTQFASLVVAPLPFVLAGYGNGVIALANPIPGRGFVRLQTHEWIALVSLQRTISGSPARTRAGALPARSIGYDGALEGAAVHDARVATLKSEGTRGFFVGGAPVLHAVGAKVNAWQHVTVLARAMQVLYSTLFLWRDEGTRQNLDGTIDPRDIELIANDCLVAQNVNLLSPENDRGLPGHVSSVRVEISKTTILPALSGVVFVKLLGYPQELAGSVTIV